MNKNSNIPIPGSDIGNENHNHYHIPVMLPEMIEALHIRRDGIYVDCTMGGGGHSRAILKQLGPEGKLVVFDQDEAAKKNVPVDERVLFIPQNFRHLQRFLKLHKQTRVDGILADLGVSSHQLDEGERGFSIRYDAALDMRMDKRQPLTAAEIIQNFSESQLHKMFEKYGEVTNSKTLAKVIVTQRSVMPIKTINQFKQALQGIVKGNPNKYFAQVFQALRIEVNDEMGALREMLKQSLTVLNSGGRIVVITFHSLEDRMVKNFFKTGTFEDVVEDDVFGGRPESPLNIITKKPIVASEKETTLNTRSRSAKLRIAEKK